MRKLATSFVILGFIASLSFAQGTMQQREGQTGMMGSGTMGGMHPMIYSMIVNHVLMNANTLKLTDIQDKYIYPMIRKEADFKISHMKIMNMLQDPNFDPANVKAEVKASNDINLDMANMSVDALAAVRKAIGVENFKQAEMMHMMGGRMMKGETPAPK
jgi:hypothetical protein